MIPKPSNTRARKQRDLWNDAIAYGWQPPADVAERTLKRWAQGHAYIPYRALADMVATIANGGGPTYDPDYFARPRLTPERTEATNA